MCDHPLLIMVGFKQSVPYARTYTTGEGDREGIVAREERVLINRLLIARPAHINDRRICFLYIYLACIRRTLLARSFSRLLLVGQSTFLTLAAMRILTRARVSIVYLVKLVDVSYTQTAAERRYNKPRIVS